MRKTILCLTLSILLVITLVPQISFGAVTGESGEGAAGLITGFAPLETGSYCYEGSPEEEELALNLPETLAVYLDGSSEISEIPVTWEAVEDYDNTDFYFYSMRPVWGSGYILDSSLGIITDVPWITVYRQEPENSEIEPIKTAEELDSIYTEEDGPVDPEPSGAEGLAGDAAQLLKNAFAEESYAASTAENTAAIYKYLKNTLGFNTAAACGIMTNICAESAMSPINLQNTYEKSLGLDDETYTNRVDKGKGAYKTGSGKSRNFKTDSAGYGLCQWTSSGRKANLLNAALNKGTSVGNMNTQLAFFAGELENSYPQVYATLKNVPNNAAGAYIAAAEMCLAYEVPANTISTAASRAKTCLSGYWKTYSGSSADASGTSFISLCGYSYPKTLKTGKGMTVSGYVVSNYKITSVTARITDSSGKVLYSGTKKPNATAFKLYGLDSAMKFSKLSAGSYKYIITAADKSGKSVTATRSFKVSAGASSQTALGFKSAQASGSESTSESEDTKTTYTGTYPTLPKRGYFKKGDTGKQVRYLQKYLTWAGYRVTTGGTYGAKTVAAVKKFQKACGLTQDGKFGAECLKKAKTIKR